MTEGRPATGRPSGNPQSQGQSNGVPALAEVLDALKQRGHKLSTSGPHFFVKECPVCKSSQGGVRITHAEGPSNNGHHPPGYDFACLSQRQGNRCTAEQVIDALNIRSLFPGGSSTGRTLKATKASQMKMRAIQWLWEEEHAKWLPLGALTLLGGREGIGKSTWAYRVAAKLTKGELPGCHHGTPKSVIVSATEDSWEAVILPRLVAVGADLERIYRVDAVTAEGHEMRLTLPEDNANLRALVTEVDAALILLDPLMSVVSGKLDPHKDQQVRQALEPLSVLADETKASIVGLIHVNKGGSDDLLTSLTGSRAFAAVARAVLFAARDQEEREEGGEDEGRQPSRFLFGQPKNNLAAEVPHTIRYHIEGVVVGFDDELQQEIWSSFIAPDGLIDANIKDVIRGQEKSKGNPDTAIGRAKIWLKAYLAANGATDVQVIFDAGMAEGHKERTLQRARSEIGAVASRGRFSEKGRWWLPVAGEDVGAIGGVGVHGAIGAIGAMIQTRTKAPVEAVSSTPITPMAPMAPTVPEVGAVTFPIFNRIKADETS